jgi:soluble cytochrome b562
MSGVNDPLPGCRPTEKRGFMILIRQLSDFKKTAVSGWLEKKKKKAGELAQL